MAEGVSTSLARPVGKCQVSGAPSVQSWHTSWAVI